jgi:hypothetical protein
METSTGEFVQYTAIWIDGRKRYVVPPVSAAKALDLTPGHIVRLHEAGELIAHKIRGQWWVEVDSIVIMQNKS